MSEFLLKNWFIANASSPYQAPEQQTGKLVGEVYGNPSFNDGEEIKTSRIVDLDLQAGIARTANSTYYLGSPNQDWLMWVAENYPESFSALVKKLDN